MKQALILRRDLKMRRGKEIVQGAHASMKAMLENMEHPDVKAWLAGPFFKIALTCDSEEEMQALERQAQADGLITARIVDSGQTEFGGVPTLTALAIGPAENARVDKITGHLKLR